MNPFRSVGARLTLALLLMVALALGVVYLAVAPSLEGRLIDSRLSDLDRSAPSLAEQLARNPFDPDFFERAATATNARVVLLRRLSLNPMTLSVVGDSSGGSRTGGIREDPFARNTSRDLRSRTGTVTRDGERYAEVAVPVGDDGTVLLLSASLERALSDVDLVKRRLLIAGAVVLALALLFGYLASTLFARRIRRLERAADRIASGQFDEPITDLGNDEVGELARAFDRMRVQLAQLDHARREFIANASHELRTPVFSLGGFLELLDDEQLDDETRAEFLTTMREQVSRLEKLAMELLDLSRLDAGQIVLAREIVAVDDVARTAAAEFAAIARQSDHPLDVASEDGVLAVGDEQRILQIARILVENALIHTPPGTALRLRVETVGGQAVLTVEDDGPGIDFSEASNVFERFYRVDGAQASGSGLGLAIARELARLMGGSVELRSLAQPTAFVLTLPTAARDADPVRRAAATSSA